MGFEEIVTAWDVVIGTSKITKSNRFIRHVKLLDYISGLGYHFIDIEAMRAARY